MTEAELKAQLDAVYDQRCQADALRLRHEEEKALAIPPDLLVLLRTIDVKFDVQHAEAQLALPSYGSVGQVGAVDVLSILALLALLSSAPPRVRAGWRRAHTNCGRAPGPGPQRLAFPLL
jgi:hypothetical protein